MLNDKWRYAVTLVNEQTGEQRTVMVELTDAERHGTIMRNNPHTSGPDGPLALSFALGHAKQQLPGFSAGELIERVVVH